MDKNNTDNNKEKDRSKKIRIGMGLFLVIDFIIFAIFFVLFPKRCSSTSNNSNLSSNQSSSSYREPFDSASINNRLLALINNQIELDGFDNDDANEIVSFIYKEDVKGNFQIDMTAHSSLGVYVYSASGCKYTPKDNNDDPIYYLATGEFEITGDIEVSKYTITGTRVEVSNEGTPAYYISYESISHNKYFSGYGYKDGVYKVYNQIAVNDDFDITKDIDPLKNLQPGVSARTHIFNNSNPIFDFYNYLKESEQQ